MVEKKGSCLSGSWLPSGHPELVLKIVLNVTKEEFFPCDLLITLKRATLIFPLKGAGLRQDK